jgi:hypothetical protein
VFEHSVGWNQIDDWHGKLPEEFDETDPHKNADWAMELPFPPLAAP